jgi:hypothetical protein
VEEVVVHRPRTLYQSSGLCCIIRADPCLGALPRYRGGEPIPRRVQMDPVFKAAMKTISQKSNSGEGVFKWYDPQDKVLVIIASGEEAEAKKKILDNLIGKDMH